MRKLNKKNFTRQIVPLLSLVVLYACGGSTNSTTTTADPNTPASPQNPDPQNPTGQNPSVPGDGENQNNNNENNGEGDNSNPPVSQARLPSGGHVSNPEFQWPSVAGASSYRLIIEDDRGDRISQQLTAQQAGCLDTTVTCNFTPSVQIHDSILKWRTQSFDASGAWIETSADTSYNTLRSLTAQPYTSLDTIGAPPNPGHGFPTIEFDKFVVLNNDWNARAMYSDAWQQTVAVDRLTNGDAQIVFEYDWYG